MLSSQKLALLSIITTFFVGMVLGVVVERFVFDKRPEKHHDINEHLLDKFTEELSLTPAQQDTLKVMLDEIKEKHREVRRQSYQEYKRIREEFEQKFSSILTQDQAARYKEMVEEFEREREKHKKRKDKRGE